MGRYERRCAVCGQLLYYTQKEGYHLAAFCPDKLCILYPLTTSVQAEDPTMPSLLMAIMESTPATPAQVNRALGRQPSYAGALLTKQRKRWSDFD